MFNVTAGGIVYISQDLVASAIMRYAPSLLYLGSAKGGISQSWQDLQPGAFLQLLSSLHNYILDDLFGLAAVLAPSTYHAKTGSIMQQVRFWCLGTKATARCSCFAAVQSE